MYYYKKYLLVYLYNKNLLVYMGDEFNFCFEMVICVKF